MEAYISRQPIFNKSMNIFGYEIQCHGKASASGEASQPSDSAVSQTIMNTFHNMGMGKITNGKRAFIEFTDGLILDRVPTILPNRVLVVEILSPLYPSDELLLALSQLKGKGYTIVFGSFVLDNLFTPFLQFCDIIKCDYHTIPQSRVAEAISRFKGTPVKLMAGGLNDVEDFEQAKSAGFMLFQGHFFSTPSVIKASSGSLSPLKVNCIRLVKYAFDPSASFAAMAEIIKHDVALSYRLLRVVNSAFFGLRYTVKNIRQALAILGMSEVKKWVTLVSLSELRDDKPEELTRLSLIRARLMELLAPQAGLARDSDDLFMVGLLSLMDVITEISLEEIIEQTNISPSVANPLQTGQGKSGELLRLVVAYERGQWQEFDDLCTRLGINVNRASDIYLDAIKWADQL